MKDAAVVPGLVEAELLFLFDDRQPERRPPPQELIGGRETDDAAPDDDEIRAVGHRASGNATPY